MSKRSRSSRFVELAACGGMVRLMHVLLVMALLFTGIGCSIVFGVDETARGVSDAGNSDSSAPEPDAPPVQGEPDAGELQPCTAEHGFDSPDELVEFVGIQGGAGSSCGIEMELPACGEGSLGCTVSQSGNAAYLIMSLTPTANVLVRAYVYVDMTPSNTIVVPLTLGDANGGHVGEVYFETSMVDETIQGRFGLYTADGDFSVQIPVDVAYGSWNHIEIAAVADVGGDGSASNLRLKLNGGNQIDLPGRSGTINITTLRFGAVVLDPPEGTTHVHIDALHVEGPGN